MACYDQINEMIVKSGNQYTYIALFFALRDDGGSDDGNDD